jgi:hypothetical protein
VVYPGTLFHRRHSATPMHSYENRNQSTVKSANRFRFDDTRGRAVIRHRHFL